MIESAEVVIKQAGHADRVVRLPEGATRMGRAEDNEIVLSDVGVSRRHAQVYVSRSDVTVEDLGSGNGTYYNGYRIQAQPVQDGDEIVIDPFTLMFRIRGQERSNRAEEPRGQGAPARLQVVNGTGAGGAGYPITSRGLSIGRSEDSDVVIADPAASRHHCQINQQSGEYVLRDMGSANGVFVNAVRVRECTLADGDLVRIGNTEMRFVREAAESPRAGAPAPRTGRFDQNRPQSSPSRNDTGRGEAVRNDTGRSERFESTGTARTTTSRARRPIFAMLFGSVIVSFGFFTVLVGIVLLVVAFLSYQNPWSTPSTQFPAQPPRWALNVPGGLTETPLDALFQQGQKEMSNRNHRAALLDFYRVLQQEPGYPYVDKFAFAAGEFLVLEALGKELQHQADERLTREKERDQLLLDVREGRRSVQLTAQNQLKRRHNEDPLVIKALGLKPSATTVAREKLAAEGLKQLDEKKYDDASKAFQDVLDGSRDPVARDTAIANLRKAQAGIAKDAVGKWSTAVMTAAGGNKADARSLFSQLKEEHSAHPSAQIHLSRLP